MTQLGYIPGSPGRSPLDAREAPLDRQSRAIDTSREATSEKKRTAPSNLTQENVAVLHTQTYLDKGDDRNVQDLTQINVETRPSSPWSVVSNPSTTFTTNPVAQTGPELREPSKPPLDDQPNSTDMVDDRSSNIIILGKIGVENNYFASSNTAQHDDTEPCAETLAGKEGSDNGQTPMKTTIEADPYIDDPLAVSSAQGDFPHSEVTEQPSQPLLIGQSSTKEIGDDTTSNIIIFGETGVGKSSVINLICGEKRAHISDDALGCTFQHEKHIVRLAGIQCALWDTMGLDEGSKGAAPAEIAEANLKDLIDELIRSGGIHLVIYCIRATRLTMALKRNYDLFYVTVCQEKVPVALIVTGLEYQEGRMETWWEGNEAILRRCGMAFDAHACVTTLEVDDPDVKARRSDSRNCLLNLVAEYASQEPWKIEESWSLGRLYDLTRGRSLMRRRTIRRVIVYDGTARRNAEVRRRRYQQLEYEWIWINTLPRDVTSAPPGALVFYTSPLFSDGVDISPSDDAALMRFYNVIGQKACPVIVVLRGCHGHLKVGKCWEAILSRHEGMKLQCIAISDVEKELEATIEHLYHEQVGLMPNVLQMLWDAVSVFISLK